MKTHKDLPREELMENANQVLEQLGDFAEVHFKFTCEKCGERCILQEPNRLHERGTCWKCGHETEIKEGGYLLEMRFNPPKKETNP